MLVSMWVYLRNADERKTETRKGKEEMDRRERRRKRREKMYFVRRAYTVGSKTVTVPSMLYIFTTTEALRSSPRAPNRRALRCATRCSASVRTGLTCGCSSGIVRRWIHWCIWKWMRWRGVVWRLVTL